MRDNIQISVVLADDHVIVRQSIRKLLEESNILVIGEASDGLEAFKLVEIMKPDVLICDINMGAMNGLEVTKKEWQNNFSKLRLSFFQCSGMTAT